MHNWESVHTANRACALLYDYVHKHNNGVWIVPVNICPDVPLTLYLASIKVEFVDISPITLCINKEECLRLIKQNPNKYSGIIYVRTYGFLTDEMQFFNSCKQFGPDIKIIDDRCLCYPEDNPKMCGADMILYSTGYCKPVEFNEGGLAYYNEKYFYEAKEVELLYDGTDETQLYKDAYKYKKKLIDIPSGWLEITSYKAFDEYMCRIKDCLKNIIRHRINLNNIYSSILPNSICMRDEYQQWRYNILVPSNIQKKIIDELFANNLFASTHYLSVNRLFDNNVFVESDNLQSCVINLFNDFHYTEEMAMKTCEIVTKILICWETPNVSLSHYKQVLVGI